MNRVTMNRVTMNRSTTGSNRAQVRRMIAGAAVAALVFSACAADDDLSSGPGNDAAEVAVATGMLPTVSGGQIDTTSLEGTDTILWFWAPW